MTVGLISRGSVSLVFARVEMNEGLQVVRAGHHVLPIARSSAAIWVLLALSVWTALHAAHLDLPWSALGRARIARSRRELAVEPGLHRRGCRRQRCSALALFSVPRTEALSSSLLFHASQYFPVTITGLIFSCWSST
jgi:hypothetical protein